MKKIIAVLFWALMLAAVCGCSGEPSERVMETEPAEVITEPVSETAGWTEPNGEDEPEDATESAEMGPECRINQPADQVFADITPFGNVAGRIVSAAGNESFLDWENDTRTKQIHTSGELIKYSVFYTFGRPVYIVDGYVEKIQALYDAVETVTGLAFQKRVSRVNKEEQLVWVALKNMFMEGGHEDSDMGSDGAFPQDRNVIISQASALLGKTDDLIAGLATVLQADHAYHRFNDIYSGGFSTYTAYKVQKYLEEHDPELAMASRDSTEILMNYNIHGGLDALCQNPMDHWIQNPNSLWEVIIGNGSSSVGFFFMMYLDKVYGDYCGWIPAYAQNYRCYYGNTTVNIDDQIQVMLDVYGEGVFEGFYPWLKEKLRSSGSYGLDYSWRKQYVYYPFFTNAGYESMLFDGKYDDMCVSLAEYRNYMTEFKGYSLDTLTLVNDRGVLVTLYDQNGHFIMATRGDRTAQDEYRIYLENVYYIQFVGKGSVWAELRLN